MGIPNESVTQNEIEEKRRQEAREEFREEQRRKKSLWTGDSRTVFPPRIHPM
jgi:hypothetical protein